MMPPFNQWRIALLVLKHEAAKTALRYAVLASVVVALALFLKAFA